MEQAKEKIKMNRREFVKKVSYGLALLPFVPSEALGYLSPESQNFALVRFVKVINEYLPNYKRDVKLINTILKEEWNNRTQKDRMFKTYLFDGTISINQIDIDFMLNKACYHRSYPGEERISAFISQDMIKRGNVFNSIFKCNSPQEAWMLADKYSSGCCRDSSLVMRKFIYLENLNTGELSPILNTGVIEPKKMPLDFYKTKEKTIVVS